MCVTSLKHPNSEDLNQQINYLYGIAQNEASFSTAIPAHQIGFPIPFNDYYCLHVSNYGDASGWPNLAAGIDRTDASAAAGKLLVSHSYKPKTGFLKMAPQPLSFPYPVYIERPMDSTEKKGPLGIYTPMGSQAPKGGQKKIYCYFERFCE